MSGPLAAVLFDVDFTLCRPGPELGPRAYAAAGKARGLALDPALYDAARRAAIDDLRQHPELRHDDEVWLRFTEDIVRGMGGRGPGVRAVAIEVVLAWERHANFELYKDALPTLAAVRAAGLKVGLVSNGARDLAEFVLHHAIDVETVVASRAHGLVKPHPAIFRAALSGLGVAPQEALMVGDSLADDVEGALAAGMRALLLDRDGAYRGRPDTIQTLAALLPLLGIEAAA